MARPKGPEKKSLTITLTKPVSDWLDSLIVSGEIRNKSELIEDLLKERMSKEGGKSS